MAEASVVVVADEELCKLASNGNVAKLEELGNLCREPANRDVYSDLVAPVAALLSGGCSLDVATQACRALANLCFEHAKNRSTLSQNKGALAFLVRKHEDSTLHRNSIGVIANLVSEIDEAGEATVEAGGVSSLVVGVSTDHFGLACRGLRNIAQKGDWAARAFDCGAVQALLACDDEGEDVIADLAVNEAFAIRLADDVPTVMRFASLKWEKPLLALCLNEVCAQKLAQNDKVWRAMDDFPRLQGLMSGSEAGSERARSEAARFLQQLLAAAAVPGEAEEIGKERGERRGGALLALGNAARNDVAVAAIWQLEGLIPALKKLLIGGNTHDQHLTTGLLGNLAVPLEGRTRLADADVIPLVASCFNASNNAHVMMNCAVLLRRLSLHAPVRPLVSKELPGVLAQRERLAQPEHARVGLELGRVTALCMADKTEANLSKDEECSLLDLLNADWSVLRVEACRGCALLASRCSQPIAARLQTILDEDGGDGTARLAAVLALVRVAPHSQELIKSLERLENDPTVVEGQPLSRVSKQLLESLQKKP